MGFSGVVMPVETGRWLNAMMNANGSVSIELLMGNYPEANTTATITLTPDEVTALSAVLTGVSGSVSLASNPEKG